MKKNLKIPTIIGIFILAFGMLAGIYLVNSNQQFKLSANIEASPKNVRISNITDSGFTVSWTTEIESNGFVKWGATESSLNKVALEETSEKGFVHTANIAGTTNGSQVFFKINSNSKDYDNNGVAWTSKTYAQKANFSNSLIASGMVLKQDGSSPAKALVYLSINGVVLSGITSDEGSFVIPISMYLENVPDNTAIEIMINASLTGTAQGVVYPKSAKAMPTMVLGKTYDFRSLTDNDSSVTPQSSVSIPESVEISSRFEVQKLSTPASSNTVTIESIDNNEIINTTDPEFFGIGPQNTSIEIAVESELQEAVVSTDSKGKWTWNPPNDLEVGTHKITVKWRDANGVLRTITRNFEVAAAEGPAFESTPSATPVTLISATPTASSSSTPKATSLSSSTPSATAPATPETGSLTPTLGLFIMGIGVLLSSFFVWNKSNA